MIANSTSNAVSQIDRAGALQQPVVQPGSLHANAATATPVRPKAKRNSASLIATVAYCAAILATLFWAWSTSEEQYIVPGSGIGYWIGIAGSVLMVILLLYPVRKKYAKVARYGRVATWFKSHMVLGILGPTLVVLHSNFELNSINATVATVVMLTVVVSGIFGRFLYSKIHRGLYGAKVEAKTLLADAEALKRAFGDDLQTVPDTLAELKDYERAILDKNDETLHCAKVMMSLAHRTRSSRKAMLSEMQTAAAARALRERWDNDTYEQHLNAAREHLDQYNAAIRKAAGLKFYDGLFGWWHVLHMPLFFLLILATVVHIIAVHFY